MNRREFLKFSLEAVSTVAVIHKMPEIGVSVNEIVREETGMQSGNASIREKILNKCSQEKDPVACVEAPKLNVLDKANAVVFNPLMEEATFRAIPSRYVSETLKRARPEDDMLLGTGSYGFSRRELMVGFISTLLFGFSHNLTRKGIDTNTIPASQLFNGSIYWLLQRKWGVVASSATHMWNNFQIVRKL